MDQQQPKKRKRKPETWTRSVRKMSNVHGAERVRTDGTLVLAKHFHDSLCSCIPQCQTKFTDQQKQTVFNGFYALDSHTEQNLYLRGLIMNTGSKKNLYTVRLNGISRVVCQRYFLTLHGIKESRLRRKVLDKNSTATDFRGKHANHRKVEEGVLISIREFLTGLEPRESHYSRQTNGSRKYLESHSSISALYRNYLMLNPEYDPNNENNNGFVVKYYLFEKIFNFEFNMSFGFPRSDICEACETFNVQIKALSSQPTNEDLYEIYTYRQDHWNEAENFYDSMKKENLHELPDNEYCITFDYQKNLPLPVTNVAAEYFLSQLWIFNFCIHNLRNEKAHMFVYSEHFARKGSNEVISCLQYYVDNIIPGNIQVLRIWMDNSFGQNKNRSLLVYLKSLVGFRFREVYVYFPVVGHSRTRCDKDFALVEIQKRKHDKMSFPSDWIRLIKEAKLQDPFEIVNVNYPLTDNLAEDGIPIVEVKDYKTTVTPLLKPADGIRPWRRLRMTQDTTFCSESTEGPFTVEVTFLKNGKTVEELLVSIATAPPAYNGFYQIAPTKKKNIKKLLEYVVVPPNKTFYQSLNLDNAHGENGQGEQLGTEEEVFLS